MHLIQNNKNALKNVATITTYAWNVENTHDLIDSYYFQGCLDTFDQYSTKETSTHVCKKINDFWIFHVKKKNSIFQKTTYFHSQNFLFEKKILNFFLIDNI